MRDGAMAGRPARDGGRLGAEALEGAKWAFTTRRAAREAVVRLDRDASRAEAGDLVLGRVEAIGQHARLQLAQGRHSAIFVGDHVVVACAARYACDQFECEAVIEAEGCDLVAGGGVAGRMLRAHDRMRAPTRLRPLARLVGADGGPVNLRDAALPPVAPPAPVPVVIAVLGSAMNAGKTTTAAALARGLRAAGLRVGAAKITGTGAFGDVHALLDAGAEHVLDFTDAGFASTYGVALPELEAVARTLVGPLARRGCEVVVAELADGVLQQETAALMRSPAFRALCRGALFAAAEPLGAVSGARAVEAAGLRLLGVSGAIGRSAPALAEARRALGGACLTREDLLRPDTARRLLRAAADEAAPGDDASRAA